MKRIAWIIAVFGLSGIVLKTAGLANAQAAADKEKLIGMYMHQHWSYKHPYAVRTWTFDDWKGYINGLHRLGYNAIFSNRWSWKPMEEALHKLGSDEINPVPDTRNRTSEAGTDPFDGVRKFLMTMESLHRA